MQSKFLVASWLQYNLEIEGFCCRSISPGERTTVLPTQVCCVMREKWPWSSASFVQNKFTPYTCLHR